MKHKRIAILLVITFLLSLFTIAVVTINISAQEEIWVEMISERTRNGKKFQGQLDPDRFAIDLSIGAVHYDSPDWKDIDNTLVPSTADVPQLGLADWEMTQDDYEWFALETLNTVPMWLFRNRTNPNSYITFNPQASIQWTNDLDQISQIAALVSDTVGQVSNNSIHWENAYEVGRNLTLFITPNRMVKHLTLESYPGDPPSFITDGENASLELRFIFDTPSGPNQPDIFVNGALWERRDRVQTTDEVEFQLDGETLFVFTHPIFSDSDITSGIGMMILTRQGGNVIVGVRVPLTFLQNAIYPVTIDPTVDLSVGASSDDAYQISSDAVSITGTTFNTDSVNEHVGLRWTGLTIPADSTIDVARMGIIIHGSAFDEPQHRIRSHLVANAGTFNTTSNSIDERPRTENSTNWDNSDLGSSGGERWEWGASSAGYGNGANLNVTVQEIINQGGWASGNALVMIYEQHTSNPNRDLSIRFYDYAASNGAHLNITYTSVSATCQALTVVVNNPADQMYFNGTTDDPTGGLWQEENVSADLQTAVTPAMNVTNDDGSGACDVTLELLTSPGAGRTMKFSLTSTAPNPGVNGIPVGSNTTAVSSLGSGSTQAIYLWVDYDDSQGGSATPTFRVDTELP